jgi:uncharacterized membrane protein
MRFVRNRRGSVVIVFAFSAMVLAVLTAVVVNQISFYLGKRKLQSATDMAALMMMTSGNLTQAHAKSLIATQTHAPNVVVTVTRGRYTPSAAISANLRFVPNATPYNAIQVDATIPATKVMLSGMLPADLAISASARAARRQTASISVGSRLVRVEGGLSAALLDAMLGYNGHITVMDYNSLASANIDAAKFLSALNTQAHLNAVTFSDVLNANVTLAQVLAAVKTSNTNGSITALLNSAAPAAGTQPFKLKEVVQLGSIAGLPIDALTTGQAFPVSVGEVLSGSAALADGDHQIALNLAAVLGDNSIAGVTLDVGEKPQVLRYDAFAEEGSSGVSTSQFKLNVNALGKAPATILKVDTTLASANVKIDDIDCHSNGQADVKVKAVTQAASVGIKAPLLPKINLVAGSNETKTVSFTPTEIAAQTYKPVRSGLGLNVGGLSLTQLLLVGPVDTFLTKIGLHVAEADVKVIEARCGTAGLVY